MAKWFRELSTEYVAGLLVLITVSVIGAAIAISIWAWASSSGPVRAMIILCFSVAGLLLLIEIWWFGWGRPAAIAAATASKEEEVRQGERDSAANAAREAAVKLQKQMFLTRERELEIAELKPAAEWASSLIERERGATTLLDYKAHLWSIALDDREPYLDIAVFINYAGVLELLIGEEQSGRLSWENRPFSQEPIVSMGTETVRPFRLHGPARVMLKLRQYVTPESASVLEKYLDLGGQEIEFWAKDYNLSVSKVSFDGSVSTGRLFGDYLAAGTAKKFKPPW